jgi:hypothetical protein
VSDASEEKSHVFVSDCIIGEIGRCEAGMMIDEGDVIPPTWQWLLDRKFVRSIESIQAEADAQDELQSGDDETKQAGRRTRKKITESESSDPE